MDAPPIIVNPATRQRQPWMGWMSALVVLVIVAVAAILFLFNPTQYGFYPRCEFYVATGIYCPGCGSLRAMYQLAHGHLLTALRCNPLLVLGLPFAGFYAVRTLAGHPWPRWTFERRVLIGFGVVLVVFTVLRNIHSAPFIYLAPP